MKKYLKFGYVVDAIILIWTFLWFYFLVFNWDVFVVKLNTNLGFTVVKGLPFVFFFVVGLLFLFIIRYSQHLSEIKNRGIEADYKNTILLLEKDIEVLKLKETLFKMQSEEMSQNSGALQSLQKRLDEISNKMDEEREEKSAPGNEKKDA